MLNIGIIGAGHIAISHLDAYKKSDECQVVAISDLNEELAKDRAEKYNIEKVYVDYKDLLSDSSIDAVSIVTPTFTHKNIVIDALKSGKHVLCEKPPALNAIEVAECEKVAKETGKILMFGFVCRFRAQQTYLKKFIDEGRMGKFINAACERTSRCDLSIGWYSDRSKGGGILKDACIHEIDTILYCMNYPKPVAVIATETFANSDLPTKMGAEGWESYDKSASKNDIETAIDGFVTLDNGASIHVKAASVSNVITETRSIDMIGENAGARIAPDENWRIKLDILEIKDNEFVESQPEVTPTNGFFEMISHFVDCVANGAECTATPDQAVILMQVIDALYESAKTGKPVVFE